MKTGCALNKQSVDKQSVNYTPCKKAVVKNTPCKKAVCVKRQSYSNN